MKYCLSLLLLLFVSVTIIPGCGGGGPTGEDAGKTEEELNATNSKADLKARLLEIAESGVSGSATAGMRESIEQIGDSELLPLLDQLESASGESQVKSIAKKMADKL